MSQPNNPQIVARQVERIVRQLTGLSTLPAVAAHVLDQVSNGMFDPAAVTDSIQSDPALTARILDLARQEQLDFSDEPTVAEAVAKLPAAVLRQAVLSIKVFEMFDGHQDSDAGRVLPRRQMALHSLAVACCAQQLAEVVLVPEQRQTAYLAGLLHDIGKCALDEVMPKSFERMIEQARTAGVSLQAVEQQHLGLDHTVLGKRLAQKWQLSPGVIAGIWLHHCDAVTLSADLPDIQIARITALANRLVHRAGLGQSGSFEAPEQVDDIAALLSLRSEQIQGICDSLPDLVQEKSALLGLHEPGAGSDYFAMIHKAAADLARENQKLSAASGDTELLTTQLSLIQTFLDDVDENAAALDLAEAFAAAWKRHLQTGLTGVYIVPDPTEPYVEIALLERQGGVDIKSLTMPEQVPAIPQVFRTSPAVQPLAEGAKWIVEQFGSDFNTDMMYMAPLRMGDKEVAVLFFEVFSKNDAILRAKGPVACQVAASAIAMALAGRKHLELAERFVGLMSTLRQTRTELARRQSLDGLAEMAAGAAHELNNPLAVISGRAQLLIDEETDPKKKKTLRQIQLRTEDIYDIVNDLMAFARPTPPEKQSIAVSELLQKAVDKACHLCKVKSIDTEFSGAEACGNVYVDIQQGVEAIAAILANAVEAYGKDEPAPVRIECSATDTNSVQIRISDTGGGMDAATVQKAAQPFFSSCPAGRRRGMGLALAQRYLQQNGGSLSIVSRPDAGTTVTVMLPGV